MGSAMSEKLAYGQRFYIEHINICIYTYVCVYTYVHMMNKGAARSRWPRCGMLPGAPSISTSMAQLRAQLQVATILLCRRRMTH